MICDTSVTFPSPPPPLPFSSLSLLFSCTNVGIFQSYAKTVPSRMKLTMKLTMREPAFMGSMTMDHVITVCDV